MSVRRIDPYRSMHESGSDDITSELSRRLDSLGEVSQAPDAGVVVRAVRAKRARWFALKVAIALVIGAIIAVAFIAPMLLTRVAPAPPGAVPTGGNTAPNALLDDAPTFGSLRSIRTPEGTAVLEGRSVNATETPLRLRDVVPVTESERAKELTSPRR